MHTAFGWDDNLERIVAATSVISPTGKRFAPSSAQREAVLSAPVKSREAERGGRVAKVEQALQARLAQKATEILKAAETGNVKLRSDAIEYLLTGEKNRPWREPGLCASASRTAVAVLPWMAIYDPFHLTSSRDLPYLRRC